MRLIWTKHKHPTFVPDAGSVESMWLELLDETERNPAATSTGSVSSP